MLVIRSLIFLLLQIVITPVFSLLALLTFPFNRETEDVHDPINPDHTVLYFCRHPSLALLHLTIQYSRKSEKFHGIPVSSG